jgi:hypothetical protein
VNEQVYTALRVAADRIGNGEFTAGRYRVKRNRRGVVIQGYVLSEEHQRVLTTLDTYCRGNCSDDEAMGVVHEYSIQQARLRGKASSR